MPGSDRSCCSPFLRSLKKNDFKTTLDELEAVVETNNSFITNSNRAVYDTSIYNAATLNQTNIK